jgi:hypothetical protein
VGDANKRCRVADRVDECPGVMAAATESRISLSMSAAAMAVATPENEARVVNTLDRLTPAQATRLLRKMRPVDPDPEPRPTSPTIQRPTAATYVPSGATTVSCMSIWS